MYFEIKKELFGRCNSKYLPEQVSLLEGFIILNALGDEIIPGEKNGIIKLKRIRAMVSLRNNSIFAHGIVPVKDNDYVKFKSFVEELFQELCQIEKIDFDTYMRYMKWVSPYETITEE